MHNLLQVSQLFEYYITFSNAWQWHAVALVISIHVFVYFATKRQIMNFQLILTFLRAFWWEGDSRRGNKDKNKQFSLLALSLHTLKPHYLALLQGCKGRAIKMIWWTQEKQTGILLCNGCFFCLLLSIERLCGGIISVCDLVSTETAPLPVPHSFTSLICKLYYIKHSSL